MEAGVKRGEKQKKATRGLCIREIRQKYDFILLRITHYNTRLPFLNSDAMEISNFEVFV